VVLPSQNQSNAINCEVKGEGPDDAMAIALDCMHVLNREHVEMEERKGKEGFIANMRPLFSFKTTTTATTCIK